MPSPANIYINIICDMEPVKVSMKTLRTFCQIFFGWLRGEELNRPAVCWRFIYRLCP